MHWLITTSWEGSQVPNCKHGTHSCAKCSALSSYWSSQQIITEEKYDLQQVFLHQQVFQVAQCAGICPLRNILLLTTSHLTKIPRSSKKIPVNESQLCNTTCHPMQELVCKWIFVLLKIIKQTVVVFPAEGTFLKIIYPPDRFFGVQKQLV